MPTEADGLLQEAGPEKRQHHPQRVGLDGAEQTCRRDVRGYPRVDWAWGD